MSLGMLILLILLIVLICGGVGHANGAVNFAWPGGILGTLLVIILILVLLGRL